MSREETLIGELAVTDILVNLLPATSETAGAIDASVLDALPNSAWLVNVGRGSTVDQVAPVDALRSERLAGACLDVGAVEPPPAGDPLWTAPNSSSRLISPVDGQSEAMP